MIRSQFAIIWHPLGESYASHKLSGLVIRLNYVYVIITNLENGCYCSNNKSRFVIRSQFVIGRYRKFKSSALRYTKKIQNRFSSRKVTACQRSVKYRSRVPVERDFAKVPEVGGHKKSRKRRKIKKLVGTIFKRP